MKAGIGIFAIILALGGCVIVTDREDWEGLDFDTASDWEETQNFNHRYISRLALGVSIHAVRTDLGEPDFSEAFRGADGDYSILRYRTQHRHSDGETTQDETTPLIFQNGALIGWGETVLRQALRGGSPEATPMSQVPGH